MIKRVFKVAILSSIVLLAFFLTKPQINSSNYNDPETSNIILSDKEIDVVVEELSLIMKEKDPRFAIEKLKQMSNQSESISASCHEILHKFGHLAYEEYDDFSKAISYNDPVCISGYTHGVIEAMFSESDDIESSLENSCDDLNNGYLTWQCHHGLGHGLMFRYSNDVDTSVKLCNKNSGGMASACANGAYMEHFNEDIDDQSFLENSGQILDFCRGREYKDDCFYNAPIQFLYESNYDYKGAIEWCTSNKLEPEEENACIAGIGSQAARRNYNDISTVQDICSLSPNDLDVACISGMLDTFFSYSGKMEDRERACISVIQNPKYKLLCPSVE